MRHSSGFKPIYLRVFIPFACGYFISFLFRVVNAVIGPDLTAALDLGPDDLGLLTAAYFITFAAAQLPLGILLDRFGPRRIEAVLLIAAAAGAFVFARADSLTGLVIGRGLIGLGVSACLMAAFTAYARWFPAARLPLVNSFQMTAGGLGVLTATTPVQAALSVTDWRGIFMILAGVCLAAALGIIAVVPKLKVSSTQVRLKDQLQGTLEIFRSPVFWQIVPWATLSQATMLAFQGLWTGPWLRDVAGFSRGESLPSRRLAKLRFDDWLGRNSFRSFFRHGSSHRLAVMATPSVELVNQVDGDGECHPRDQNHFLGWFHGVIFQTSKVDEPSSCSNTVVSVFAAYSWRLFWRIRTTQMAPTNSRTNAAIVVQRPQVLASSSFR